MKAIILAGGQGTRLRPVIGNDLPKCLAPVMGKPMIEIIINGLEKQGITDITLALGYKGEKFLDKFGHYRCIIEKEPLGTGGAIKNCLEGAEPVLVLNGDTISTIDYNAFIKKHHYPLTIAVDHNGQSAGIYILYPEIFNDHEGAFSFERDVIPHTSFWTHMISHFVDMGTPESYREMCKEWV